MQQTNHNVGNPALRIPPSCISSQPHTQDADASGIKYSERVIYPNVDIVNNVESDQMMFDSVLVSPEGHDTPSCVFLQSLTQSPEARGKQ